MSRKPMPVPDNRKVGRRISRVSQPSGNEGWSRELTTTVLVLVLILVCLAIAARACSAEGAALSSVGWVGEPILAWAAGNSVPAGSEAGVVQLLDSRFLWPNA